MTAVDFACGNFEKDRLRKQGSCVEKEIKQRTMKGRRPRTANIKTWTGLEESVRMTDRNKLRKYVHHVVNPRIEDGKRTERTVRIYTVDFQSIVIPVL